MNIFKVQYDFLILILLVGADQTLKDLENITTTLSELKTSQSDLSTKIAEINTNFTHACSNSNPVIPQANCPHLPTVANNFIVVCVI